MEPDLVRALIERGYCTREQVQEIRKRLPHPSKFRAFLIAGGYVTRKQLEEIETSLEMPVPEVLETVEEPGRGTGWSMPRPERLGSYEIVADVGKGAMGIVYRARHRVLGHDVAIKVLPSQSLRHGDAYQRFLREAQVTSHLSHENIVKVFDWGHEGDIVYFVMEYVSGSTLERLIERDPPGQLRALRMVETIARAIHHAHENGVLHRDLKPGNVLVGEDGSLKVSDFGLARLLRDDATITKSGTAIGTPAYMPPEQVRGDRKAIDRRSDVYSLGVILYELLAGRRPFNGRSTAEIFRQVESRQAPSIHRYNPSVSKAVEAICVRAMAKDPFERYSTALAMAEDIRRYLEHQRLDSKTDSGLVRLRRKTRGLKRPVLWAGVVLAAALSGALAVLWVLAGSAPDLERDGRGAGAVETPWAEDETAFEKAIAARDYQAAAEARRSLAERGAPDSTLERCRERAADSLARHFTGLLSQGDLAGVASLLDLGRELGLSQASVAELRDLARSRAIEAIRQDLERTEFAEAQEAIHAVREVFGDEPVLAEFEMWARGVCPFSLATRPAGCRVRVSRYDTEAFRTIGEETDLGETPVRQGLKFGPYLVRTSTPGGRDHVFPVLLARGDGGRPVPVELELDLESVPPEMVLVPGGEFLLGPPANERRVRVRTLLMDRTEVTNADYARFLASLPTDHARFRHTPYHDYTSPTAHRPWRGSEPPAGRADHPLVYVAEASSIGCALRAGKRLPTADEWEVAARGIDRREFPWGNELRMVRAVLGPGATPEAVGTHPDDRSPYGCLDMGGNVRERAAAPQGARSSSIMGGSFGSFPNDARSFLSQALERWRVSPEIGARACRSTVAGDLVRAMSSPDPGVRIEAARQAGLAPSSEALTGALRRLALEDADDVVRKQACLSLASLGSPGIAEESLELVRAGGGSPPPAAVEAAAALLPPSRLGELLVLVEGHESLLDVADHLLDRPDPEAAPAYRALQGDLSRPSRLRHVALLLLAGLGDEPALDALRSLARSGDAESRAAAVSLWKLGDPAAILPLLEVAYHAPESREKLQPDFYWYLACYLMHGRGIDEFRRGLEQENEGIRLFCAFHLGAIGDREAAPLLERLASSDPQTRVREAAAKALEELRRR